MLELLKFLRDTPLPIVLVLGGIAFIGISFLRKVSSSVEPDPSSTGLARISGLVLLVIGIGLYLVPPPQPASGIQQPVRPPEGIGGATPTSQAVSTPRTEVQRQPSATPLGGVVCDQDPIVSEKAAEGTKKTYVRCPVGDVEYIIQPDDFLTSIVLDCPDTGQQSISFKKNEQLSQGELLPVYDSARFTSRQGCKVYITIVNTVSNLMGYRLRQELR